MWCLYCTHFFPQGSVIHTEKEPKDCKSQRRWWSRELSSRYGRADAHVSSQWLRQHARDPHKLKADEPQMRGREWVQTPPSPRSSRQRTPTRRGKVSFRQWRQCWSATLRGRPRVPSGQPVQTRLCTLLAFVLKERERTWPGRRRGRVTNMIQIQGVKFSESKWKYY